MPKLAYRVTMPRPGDQTIIDAYCDAIELGHAPRTAAPIAGIHERTAAEWLQLGREELSVATPGTPLTELGSHALFAQSVIEAQARFVSENLDFVRGARDKSPKGWLPAMTLMDRRMPEDWGQRQHTTVDTRSLNVSVTLEALPEAQRVALIAALARPKQLAAPDVEHDITTDD